MGGGRSPTINIKEEKQDDCLRLDKNTNGPANANLPTPSEDSSVQKLTKEFKKQNFKISIEECKSP